MAAILALYPAFTRAWLPNQCGRYRRHWFVWNGVLSPKFVQPDCTATTNRIQVGEMLLHEAVEAYKKEGPKFMQRLLAKQKTSVLREYALQTEASVDSSRITGNPDIIR